MPQPIKVSGVRRLADASFCYSSLDGWEQTGRLSSVLDLMRKTWRSRAYGDFYGYMLLAEGALDIMVEPELMLWDMAALDADRDRGGRHLQRSFRAGRASGGGSAVATNGQLHTDVLERLTPSGLHAL